MAILRTISIKKELNEKVQDYCKNTGRTVSGLVSFLLNKYLGEADAAVRSGTIQRQTN